MARSISWHYLEFNEVDKSGPFSRTFGASWSLRRVSYNSSYNLGLGAFFKYYTIPKLCTYDNRLGVYVRK